MAKPWIVPAAAAYVFYVAVSHLIWSEASPNGRGWTVGLVQAAALSIPGFLLLRARNERKPEGRAARRSRAKRAPARRG